MAQTKEGIIKQKQTIIDKYGPNYWVELGRMGGKAKVPKGFALNRELAASAGRKGGTNSRRGKANG